MTYCHPLQTIAIEDNTESPRPSPAGVRSGHPGIPFHVPSSGSLGTVDAETWYLGAGPTISFVPMTVASGVRALQFPLVIEHDRLTAMGIERYTPYAGNSYLNLDIAEVGGPLNLPGYMQFELPPGLPMDCSPLWMNGGAPSLLEGMIGPGPFSNTQLIAILSFQWTLGSGVWLQFRGRQLTLGGTLYIPDEQGGPHLAVTLAPATAEILPVPFPS